MSDEIDLELEQIRFKRMQKILNSDMESVKKNIPKGIVHLTDGNFDSFIKENSETPIFIDYWADWCMPCKRVAPIIEALEKRHHGKMIFAKLDTENNPKTAQKFRIFSIPTFHVFYQNKIIEIFSGALPGNKFEERIQKVLNFINKPQGEKA